MEQIDKKIELQKTAINHILSSPKLIKNFWANNITVSDDFVNTINKTAPANIKWLVRAGLSLWSSEPLSLFDLYKNLAPSELARVSEALVMLSDNS